VDLAVPFFDSEPSLTDPAPNPFVEDISEVMTRGLQPLRQEVGELGSAGFKRKLLRGETTTDQFRRQHRNPAFQ
jgi:hypothetical protein